jgi:dTMP kinase
VAFLIDFEGIDGSGKGTQSQRLVHRLNEAGVQTALISFPRYSATLFGKGVGDFLNGRFGPLSQVDPFLVSLLYAGDRFESRGFLIDAMERHQVVVFDRYVPSNIAHQASKKSGAERDELVRWIERIEYEIYQLPRVDLTVLLDLSPGLAQQLIAKKAARNYTDRAADLQEADHDHLVQTHAVYQQLASSQPGWEAIACASGDSIRSIDDIHADVWDLVRERLVSAAITREL